jgi:hypothetical protein
MNDTSIISKLSNQRHGSYAQISYTKRISAIMIVVLAVIGVADKWKVVSSSRRKKHYEQSMNTEY